MCVADDPVTTTCYRALAQFAAAPAGALPIFVGFTGLLQLCQGSAEEKAHLYFEMVDHRGTPDMIEIVKVCVVTSRVQRCLMDCNMKHHLCR